MKMFRQYFMLPLILFGAIHLGLIGLLRFDIVSEVFGQTPIIGRIIYVAIGVAGIMYIVLMSNSKK